MRRTFAIHLLSTLLLLPKLVCFNRTSNLAEVVDRSQPSPACCSDSISSASCKLSQVKLRKLPFQLPGGIGPIMMNLLYPPIAYCNLGKYRFEYGDPVSFAVIRHRAWQCPSRSL